MLLSVFSTGITYIQDTGMLPTTKQLYQALQQIQMQSIYIKDLKWNFWNDDHVHIEKTLTSLWYKQSLLFLCKLIIIMTGNLW